MADVIGCSGRHAPSGARTEPGRRRLGRQAGISLVEVVIASAILAVSMLLISASVTTALRANAFARERGIATAAAEAKLEELIAHPLQPVLALPGLLLFNGTTFPVDGLSGAGGARAGSVRIDPTGVPLVTVEVTVAWVGSFGADRISLKTTVLTVSTGL